MIRSARSAEKSMKNWPGNMSRRELMQDGLGLAAAAATGGIAVTPTSASAAFTALPAPPRMPTLFAAHGSPMNAITDNAYSREWSKLGDTLPTPSAILCVSAHWMTRGTTLVHVAPRPRTIHDFGGFPQALFDRQYPGPGAPDVAKGAIELVRASQLQPDTES